MKLATIQASAIKSTFEVLKDILNDVPTFIIRGRYCYDSTLIGTDHSLVRNFSYWYCNGSTQEHPHFIYVNILKSLPDLVITQKNFFLFYTKYLLEKDVEIQI